MSTYKVEVWHREGSTSFHFDETHPFECTCREDGVKEGVRKVVFHRMAGNRAVPVLAMDTLRSSKLRYDFRRRDQRLDEVKITAEVRCLFLKKGFLTLAFELEADKAPVVHFKDIGGQDDVLRSGIGGPELRNRPLIPLLTEIERGDSEGIGIFNHDDHPNMISRIFRSPFLDLVFRERQWRLSNRVDPPRFRVRLLFRKRTHVTGNYHQPGFEATDLWRRPYGTGMRLFPDTEAADFGFDPQMNSTFSATQIPSPEMDLATADAEDRWLVEVAGLPACGVAAPWNHLQERYHKSLHWVGGSRQVSWLPALDQDVASCTVPWSVLYEVRDRRQTSEEHGYELAFYGSGPTSSEKIDVRCVAVYARGEGSLSATLPLVRSHRGEPLRCVVPFGPPSPATMGERVSGTSCDSFWNSDGDPFDNLFLMDRKPGILLSCPTSVASFDPQAKPDVNTVRVGALDLRFGGREGSDVPPCGYFYQRFEDPENTSVDVAVRFAVSAVVPGGQDGVPGELAEACLDAFSREVEEAKCRLPEPPIVVPYGTTPEGDKLHLLVRDRHRPGRDHQIDLMLWNKAPAGAEEKQQVIVLEREPFLVGGVAFTAFTSLGGAESSEIANWRNYGSDASSWRIRTRDQFDLLLPPQALGEEMEKYGNVGDEDVLDFRFGPPAKAELRTTYFRQNFPEPPWNLRRILGFDDRGNPGAVVRHLQYELLYGLSCSFEYPLARLAELEAVVGPVPRALPEEPGWLPASRCHAEPLACEVTEAYRAYRSSWWDLSNLLRSRLAVFEAWDEATRDTLELKDDARCLLRIPGGHRGELPEADLRDPFGRDADPETLAGGVTWGFESLNVYDAVLRDPRSNTADVADLFLSSLGGWGRQKATFDEKRTAVYADTSMGRTYAYRLERVGRIAVWWNRAKHVIVYKRTVAPSEQWVGDQSPLLGRPVLRKVEEYVEILEEVREYPDGAGKHTAGARQQRGPIEACVFEKGVRFPVRSDWGTEVGRIGWKVPIWRQAMEPADLYVKPCVKLRLTCHLDDERVSRLCRIADPENFYFYTDTRQGTGADTDAWLGVESVDYVDQTRPRRASDFEHGELRPTTLRDQPVPPGFAPCTFHLEPCPIPVDLLAERGLEPMAAHLETVTMARAAGTGKDPSAAPVPAGVSLPKLINETFARYLQRLPQDPADMTEEVRDDLRRFFDQGDGKLAEAREHLVSLKGAVDRAGRDVVGFDPFGEAERELEERFSGQIDQARAELEKRLGDNLRRMLTKAATRPELCEEEKFEKWLHDEVRGAVMKARDELERSRFTPGVVVQAIGPGIDKVVEALSSTAARIEDFKSRVERYRTLGKAQLQAVVDEIDGLRKRIDEIEAQADQALAKRPFRNLPHPLRTLLGLKLDGRTLEDLLPPTAQVESALEALRNRIEDLGDGVIQAAELNALETALDTLRTGCRDVADRVVTFRGRLQDDVRRVEEQRDQWIEATRADLERQVFDRIRPLLADCRDLVGEIDGIRRDAIGALRDLWEHPETGLKKDVEKNLGELKSAVEEQLPWVEPAQRRVGDLAEEIGNAIAEAHRQTGDLRRYLETKRDEILQQVDDGFDRLIPGAGEGRELFATAQHSLRVIRAFGKPPEVSGLRFDDPTAAFFFNEADKKVGITPIVARAAQVSQAAGALKPLGIDLPVLDLGEKLIPQELRNFDLSKILPDFGGLRLSDLFKGIKMPETSDAVDVQHGFDKQTRRPWLKARIDVELPDRQPVFSTGPLALWLSGAEFTGLVSIEAEEGLKLRRKATGSIQGDWELVIGSTKLVMIRRTELRFDDDGDLHFDIDPDKIELPEALAFVTELIDSFLAGAEASGVSVNFLGDGVEAAMALPIPDLQGATFGISGLTLFTSLQLRVVGGKDFAIGLDFALAKQEVPFALTVFILGGSGYVDAQTLYFPSTGQLQSRVSLALMASASLALSLGPISGGVYVYFGVTAYFASGGTRSGLTIGILFLVRGRVSVLSIASASIALMLEATYKDGSLVGRGRITIKIKICWCFTLKVNQSVTYTIAGSGGGGGDGLARRPADRPAARLAHVEARYADLPPRGAESVGLGYPVPGRVRRGVKDWIDMMV